jgi:hypothetical protein
MHIHEGKLRAYQDGELEMTMRNRIKDHLNDCPSCQANLAVIEERALQIQKQLNSLGQIKIKDSLSTESAWAELQSRLERKSERLNGKSKTFHFFAYRPYVWASICLLLVIGFWVYSPSVRALAYRFLHLFRMEQVAMVKMENAGTTGPQSKIQQQFQQLLAENVGVEIIGNKSADASLAEAELLSGMSLQLPLRLGQPSRLMVAPHTILNYTVDLKKARIILNQLGRSDLQLPEEMQGARLTLDMPATVTAFYGTCPQPVQSSQEMSLDDPAFSGCAIFTQLAPPSVTAKTDLEISRLGELFLQFMGMNELEARQFSQTINWATTFALPFSETLGQHQEIIVNGVKGSLLTTRKFSKAPRYCLIWIQEGTVYVLSGHGTSADAEVIASSVKLVN